MSLPSAYEPCPQRKFYTTALQTQQCERNTQRNNVRFLPGTATHVLLSYNHHTKYVGVPISQSHTWLPLHTWFPWLQENHPRAVLGRTKYVGLPILHEKSTGIRYTARKKSCTTRLFRCYCCFCCSQRKFYKTRKINVSSLCQPLN